ncbi:hypothetical protein BGZ95_004474 [Linnemannia exigua]|uniref:F-box domain-containing protein n=1 Tax=Linnemannia exigua TaxID=604196 RepID=A0AAD4D301_9FUNG|nr:hypothetical protein BGZ95_004474 [Linnemannia exigua]
MTFAIAPLSTLATLPTEILESIILFLSQHDLAQCVRISRDWNEAMIPHLWRTIPVFRKEKHIKRFMLPDSQLALCKNAVYVRELQVQREKLYKQFLPSRQQIVLSDAAAAGIVQSDNNAVFTIGPFTNLRVLELHHLQPLRKYEFDEGISEIVRQNPSLRRLKIGIEMEPTALFSLVTEHVSSLQELDIEAPWRGNVKALLDNLPESLRTVRLNDVAHQVAWEDIESSIDPRAVSAPIKRPLQHHTLESLHIDGNLEDQEEQILLPFLEGCNQNLKTFLGTRMAYFLLSFQNAKMSHVISKMRFFGTHLHGDYFSHTKPTDSHLAQVICFGANWTHIDLLNQHVGPLTVAAIVDNCERLEVLDIMEGGGPEQGSKTEIS